MIIQITCNLHLSWIPIGDPDSKEKSVKKQRSRVKKSSSVEGDDSDESGDTEGPEFDDDDQGREEVMCVWYDYALLFYDYVLVWL